jgi:hypothetical protein
MVIRLDGALRYESVELIRSVPLSAPQEWLLGRRMPDVHQKDFVFQVVSAAERSICEGRPVEIQYTLYIKGKPVRSRARISTPEGQRIIVAEVTRP